MVPWIHEFLRSILPGREGEIYPMIIDIFVRSMEYRKIHVAEIIHRQVYASTEAFWVYFGFIGGGERLLLSRTCNQDEKTDCSSLKALCRGVGSFRRLYVYVTCEARYNSGLSRLVRASS